MTTKHIFIASSSELKKERDELADFKARFTESYPDVPTYVFDNYKTLRRQVTDILSTLFN